MVDHLHGAGGVRGETPKKPTGVISVLNVLLNGRRIVGQPG